MANFSVTAPIELANTNAENAANSYTSVVHGTNFAANSGGLAIFVNNTASSNATLAILNDLSLANSPSNFVNLSVRPTRGQVFPRSI